MPAQARTRSEPDDDPERQVLDPASAPTEDLGQYGPDQGRAEALVVEPEEPHDEEAARRFAALAAPHADPRYTFTAGSAMLGGSPDDDLRDDHPLSAAEALAEVFRNVQPIAKGRQAEQAAGGYRFRGIDDVYAALHDLFAEVGLVCLPSTIGREREQRARASGNGVNYVTHVHVRLRFLAQDGSSEELDCWGEGADTGDKSTSKAYSQAIKSALLAAFLIPTEASAGDDPDQTNTPPSRPFSAAEVERAGTALAAAREARTVEQLAGVRHRALQLLGVPVTEQDGTVAPLGFLIDLLRQAIEQTTPTGQQS